MSRNESNTWFEVKNDQQRIARFYLDLFARPHKRGGAWMSSFRQASAVDGKVVRPIITNNLNITPPAEGDPTLLSFGQVNTLLLNSELIDEVRLFIMPLIRFSFLSSSLDSTCFKPNSDPF